MKNPANDFQSESFESIRKHILTSAKTIAVVGLSTDPAKPSFMVAKYLKGHGYRIIPVNPSEKIILEERAYPSLSEISEPIDVVNIFRKSEALPGLINEALRLRVQAIWIQQGEVADTLKKEVEKQGIRLITNE